MFHMGDFLFQVVWNMNVLLPLFITFAFKYVSQKIQIRVHENWIKHNSHGYTILVSWGQIQMQ